MTDPSTWPDVRRFAFSIDWAVCDGGHYYSEPPASFRCPKCGARARVSRQKFVSMLMKDGSNLRLLSTSDATANQSQPVQAFGESPDVSPHSNAPRSQLEIAMFDRFTEHSRQVVVSAQGAARSRCHQAIDIPHILIGLISQENTIARRVLGKYNITSDLIDSSLPAGDTPTPTGQIPFTPSAKAMLERSLREALGTGANYIGTEHLLLAACRPGEPAADLFHTYGINPENIRASTLKLLQLPDQPSRASVHSPSTRVNGHQAARLFRELKCEGCQAEGPDGSPAWWFTGGIRLTTSGSQFFLSVVPDR